MLFINSIKGTRLFLNICYFWNIHTERGDKKAIEIAGRSLVLPRLESEYGAMNHLCAYSNRNTTALLFLDKQKTEMNTPNLVDMSTCVSAAATVECCSLFLLLYSIFGQTKLHKNTCTTATACAMHWASDFGSFESDTRINSRRIAIFLGHWIALNSNEFIIAMQFMWDVECFGLKKIEHTKRNVPTKDTHQPREKYSGKIGWNGIWVAIKLSFGRVTFTRKIVHSLTHSPNQKKKLWKTSKPNERWKQKRNTHQNPPWLSAMFTMTVCGNVETEYYWYGIPIGYDDGDDDIIAIVSPQLRQIQCSKDKVNYSHDTRTSDSIACTMQTPYTNQWNFFIYFFVHMMGL